MKDLNDIQTTHEGVIETLISQKAMYDAKFQEKMGEIKDEINSTSLRHLDVVKRIDSLLDWVVQMLLNTNAIILNYQKFVDAILENIEISEESLGTYEEKLAEQSAFMEGLREKNETLKLEIQELKTTISGYQVPRQEIQKQFQKEEPDYEEEVKHNWDTISDDFVLAFGKNNSLKPTTFLRELFGEDKVGSYHVNKLRSVLEEKGYKKMVKKFKKHPLYKPKE